MKSYFQTVCSKSRNLVRNEQGQGLVEYTLVLVLVACVVIAALTTLGTHTRDVLSTVSTKITSP
jgi:pilus assembly protein Flp/PilA